MTIKLYPTKIEAVDEEISCGLFTLEGIDEVCCTLTIDTPVCKESWPEISQAVLRALVKYQEGL